MTETTANGSAFTSDILMNLIVSLLAPMFLGVSGGDIGYARFAATQTIAAYRATGQADLISVAQIIAFGLAALGSLSLSMADDISLTMTLRLRGNANALNRSAEQNRRAVAQRNAVVSIRDRAGRSGNPPVSDDANSQQQPAPTYQAECPCPPSLTDTQRHTMWANAMTNVARECTASLPHLPPVERQAASFRATALSSCASYLLSGIPAPAGPPGLSGKAPWQDAGYHDRTRHAGRQIDAATGSPGRTAVSPT